MSIVSISYNGPLRGEIKVPGDKSISHRSIMLGALAKGTTRVRGFLNSADCLSTMSCFRRMGIEINASQEEILIHGRGLHGLSRPSDTMDTGNSGTTMRLLSGILAGQKFDSVLDGDASIRRRPMKRILDPLLQMGVPIRSLFDNGCAPLQISCNDRTSLKAIRYASPVASAQVKSCVLLAGLYADGETSVTEPVLSRDHTERMLRAFGANVTVDGTTASVSPDPVLEACDITVPGDISSAAYFISAALLTPGSEVVLTNVGMNPTRDGFLKVCKAMGGDITVLKEYSCCGEPAADLLIRSSSLKGTVISGSLIPTLIDELPVAAVMAAFADGETLIRDARELRVKESDRIQTICSNLRLLGADAEELDDGMRIAGNTPLHGGTIDSFEDHRVAMSFAAAACAVKETIRVKDADCVKISYPGFFEDLRSLQLQG